MLTAARRSIIGSGRRRDTAQRALVSLAVLADERAAPAEHSVVPDKRLELLFACAHPAIDPSVHSPLMLQSVMGLDAVRIGAAFLVAPATLGQQLVRAKRKIKVAGVPFRVPERDELPERAAAVFDAVYAAYGTGWDDLEADRRRRVALVGESLRLAELLCELVPEDAEAHGLAALLWHTESRSTTRRDPAGAFVPLSRQDPATWSVEAIERGDRHLMAAAPLRWPGPYQVQAAIQAVHNRRRSTGATDWAIIVNLYGTLLAMRPSVGAAVARAGARLEAEGPEAALAALGDLDPAAVAGYQPYWAVRMEALLRSGASGEQLSAAYAKAVELAADPSVREHLHRRISDG
jgi:RNA polymerase sigma-70 factor (ECF subfamily)